MDGLIRVGRLVFAAAMMCFGVLYLVYAMGVGGVTPGPPWSAGSPIWAWIVGIGFIGVGACIVLRRQGQLAATLLGIVLLLRVLFVFLPRLVAHIHDPGPWTSGFEVLAMSGAALVLAAMLPVWGTDFGLGKRNVQNALAQAGRYMFAIALVVFAVQHFMYGAFVATLVPAWIPWHLFWAYFVGVAFLAAALSIATNKASGLAGILLGAMFLLWVVMLHAPRVAASPHNGNEWTSEFVALAMGGASLVMASAGRRDGAAAVRPA
ncbi:MAG TPA: hypothetical protein VIX42_12565 [Edaphobacter sp.]